VQWVETASTRQVTDLPDSSTKLNTTWDFPSAIAPNSLQVTWQDGANLRTAHDDGLGSLHGDASGLVFYSTGQIVFSPNSLPAIGTAIHVAIMKAVSGLLDIQRNAVTVENGNYKFTIPAAVTPSTVLFDIALSVKIRTDWHTSLIKVRDDGLGHLIVDNVDLGTPISVGTINYATGVCLIKQAGTGFLKIYRIGLHNQ